MQSNGPDLTPRSTASNFYNMPSTIKRLASLNQKQQMVQKRHLLNIAKRDETIRKEIELKNKK